jgi:hypothetical protein
MKHKDFKIGTEFFTSAGKWRCTDVGTRVIVAISLGPRTLVRTSSEGEDAQIHERFVSHDPNDLVGPPYSVPELVFDEDDLKGCFTQET